MGIMHDLSVTMKAHLNESNESDEENEKTPNTVCEQKALQSETS
jgi:hypothetical protein